MRGLGADSSDGGIFMTENSAWKRAARAYQAANPGTPFPEAMRMTDTRTKTRRSPKRPSRWSRVLHAVAGSVRSLSGEQLATENDVEAIKYGGWSLDLDPRLENACILDVVIDEDTFDFQVHDVLPDGARLGEARVEAELTYDASIFRADYYTATADEAPEPDWYVSEDAEGERYVLVQGEVEVELVAHVQVNGEEIEVEFVDIELR
jgi:hypothetical protein